jgi:ferredoxin
LVFRAVVSVWSDDHGTGENVMKVWIDQDLCTGDGLCEEIAPETFFGQDDGLFYVKESASNFGTEKKFDGAANPAGAEGMARIPENGIEAIIEAAEECPGECIFIEVE